MIKNCPNRKTSFLNLQKYITYYFSSMKKQLVALIYFCIIGSKSLFIAILITQTLLNLHELKLMIGVTWNEMGTKIKLIDLIINF